MTLDRQDVSKPNDEDCREDIAEYKKVGTTFREFVSIAALSPSGRGG